VKIAILTSEGPGNGAITSAIMRTYPDVRVFVEKHHAMEPLRRVLRRRHDPWLRRLDRLAFFAWFGLRHARTLRRAIAAAVGDDRLPPDATVWAGRPDDALLGQVRAHAPHVIVVLGASPLPPAWCAAAPAVINVHTGWMPEYRGRFCWYWPVAEGDHRRVGVTVHRLSEELDAGEILWRSRLDALPLTLEELLAELLVRARTGVLQVLAGLERGDLEGTPDATPRGPLRFEPGMRDHTRFVRNLRRLASRPPEPMARA
jgi:folate-dependent phosphoribosylglycinamide formyltransferase PurN